MIKEGQVVLFEFPQANRDSGKLRPALVVRELPGKYQDWLICMISSQLSQQIAGFDEVVDHQDTDFQGSGLKVPSAIRICRIAVVNKAILSGTIGEISHERLARIKDKLANWLKGA